MFTNKNFFLNHITETILGEVTIDVNFDKPYAKKSIYFFHEIKNIFFIFTNNFIDLDILNMSAIFHMV